MTEKEALLYNFRIFQEFVTSSLKYLNAAKSHCRNLEGTKGYAKKMKILLAINNKAWNLLSESQNFLDQFKD